VDALDKLWETSDGLTLNYFLETLFCQRQEKMSGDDLVGAGGFEMSTLSQLSNFDGRVWGAFRNGGA
jgi:hypothetical protein